MTKANKILALLDAKTAEAADKNAKMAIRRLLLDGVKIIEPYRRVLAHDPGPSTDAEAVANEVKLMETWVKMARVLALKLKRSAQGKTDPRT